MCKDLVCSTETLKAAYMPNNMEKIKYVIIDLYDGVKYSH